MANTKKKAVKSEQQDKKVGKNSSVGKTSKEILDKGLEASKKWFESARKTISEWGDESVKQVEIAKLNSKLEKGYKALGKIVYSKLTSKKGSASVSTDDEEIGEAVKLLSDMAKQIKKLGGSPDTGSKTVSRKKDAVAGSESTKQPVTKVSSRKNGTTAEKTAVKAKKSAVKAGSKVSRTAAAKKTTAPKKTGSKKEGGAKKTGSRSRTTKA